MESGHERLGRAEALVRKDLDRHQPDAPGNSADAGGVVAPATDHPGHGRAVPQAVGRIAVAVHRVGAVNVIHVAVAVVVHAVRRDLARVRPEVSCEVRMAGVDPSVEDRNGDVPADARAPCARDSGGAEGPLLPEERIRGGSQRARLEVSVGLHPANVGAAAKSPQRGPVSAHDPDSRSDRSARRVGGRPNAGRGADEPLALRCRIGGRRGDEKEACGYSHDGRI